MANRYGATTRNRIQNRGEGRRPVRRSGQRERVRRSQHQERLEKAEIMLKSETFDAIEEVAQNEGISTGQVFETAISDWLDSYYDDSQDSGYYEEDEE